MTRVRWGRLERLSLPDDHAHVHAYLGHHVSAPMPRVAALLGAEPHLARLRLSSRPPPGASSGAGDLLMRLVLDAGGRVVLRMSGALVQGLLAQLADPHAARTPPLPVSPAEAGMVAAVVAAALEDLARERMVLDDLWAPPLPGHSARPGPSEDALHAPEELPGAALWCESSWTLGDAVGGSLLACLDAEAAQALGRAARAQPPPVAAARAAGLALAADFLAAEALSTARETASLGPGDVIAFPGAPPAGTGWLPGSLFVEGWRLGARLERTPEGRHLIITGEETQEEIPMTEPNLGARAGAPPTDALQTSTVPGGHHGRPMPPPSSDRLEHVPVRLSVSLGKVTLSAADLLRLEPGAVIELHEPVGGAVELLAGGRPYAEGELVEVDGALGLRITRLLP